MPNLGCRSKSKNTLSVKIGGGKASILEDKRGSHIQNSTSSVSKIFSNMVSGKKLQTAPTCSVSQERHWTEFFTFQDILNVVDKAGHGTTECSGSRVFGFQTYSKISL